MQRQVIISPLSHVKVHDKQLPFEHRDSIQPE